MAQRKVQGSRQTRPRARASAQGSARVEPLGIDGWRQECDRLRRELTAARAEIAGLKTREEQILNRIDWILDSLESLGEGGS